MTNSNWDYFAKDTQYSDELKSRLVTGFEMESAKGMTTYLNKHASGDLNVVDYGSGPGHYYPVLKRGYLNGALSYLGVDTDESNVRFGSEHFRDDPTCELKMGSVLAPESVSSDVNCVLSANTLPHVPTIEPLLRFVNQSSSVKLFIFRMLIGIECVQVKKHLSEYDFEGMFEKNFQLNNIYSVEYFRHILGQSWELLVEPDLFEESRLEVHRVPAQEIDPFYSNRVSRVVGSLIFKGDIYMPWRFLVGKRFYRATSRVS